MGTLEEFSVTEAGMRAVLETVVNLNHAVTELSRQMEILMEQAAISELRMQELEAAFRKQTAIC